MKLFLVSPRRSPHTGEQITAPHLGLLALAAAIRESTFHDTAGVDIEIVDDQLRFLIDPERQPGDFVDDADHIDVIAVQAVTSGLSNAIAILDRARARFPGALTVLGGVGASQEDERLVAAEAADVVVRGEGELPFSALLYHHGASGRAGLTRVPGITYRDDHGRVMRNPPPLPIRDLDALPLPARDLVDFSLYRRISRGRCGNIVISRGCSYACAYCYSRHHWGRGQRRASVDRVIEEMRCLVNDFGLDRIRFEDDDFTENPRWVEDICDRIEAAGLHRKMEWEAKGRPEHMKPELLARMRKAGCFRLLMGVETLDAARLRSLDRPLRAKVIDTALERMRNAGIGVQATMILGLPGETGTEMRATIEWLQERLTGSRDIVSPCFYVPFFAGIDQAMRRNFEYTIEIADRDCYTGHIPVTSSAACSHDELWQLYVDMTPERRGMYDRIAHLAGWSEVQRRIGTPPRAHGHDALQP